MCEILITWPVELVTETIWGSRVTVLDPELDPLGDAAVTSMPINILPFMFVAGVNSEGFTVKDVAVACPAVPIAAGTIAKVLPWLELSTIRSSSSLGVGHLRLRTEVIHSRSSFGPPWPATGVGSEESAERGSVRPDHDGPASATFLVTGTHGVLRVWSKNQRFERQDQDRDWIGRDGSFIRPGTACIGTDYEPLAMASGATDLVDEAANSKISGEEERYSHVDLPTFRANVDGAQEIVDLLRPYLQAHAPTTLARIDQRHQAVLAALAPYATEPGYLGTGYVDYSTVTDPQRQQLSAAVNAYAEALSDLSESVS